ncbi:RsmB/NOP family class I SAM-dependent RNA methyltransferase [Tepidicella baoligensis]|uniref:RsmB/NOP family class I SAM-dependent RNA methyltransferase n=1 Tax=Tepidicella baoligensis TaxID=2707016 RepID=UPI001C5CBC64|nr:RsmB/NOP family class I SAM-dependent RNA methyltransferase [Tepidicella baoligensis]
MPEAFLHLLDAVVPASQRPMVDASYTRPHWTSFRLNTLKADPADTLAELMAQPALNLEALDGVDGVFLVPPAQREHLTHHPAAGDGRIYIQGLSSMAAVWALDPQPGEEILDLAAAPGGKTSYIAARMQGMGRLAAVEPVKARFHRLKANLQRLGAGHVHTYLKDGAVVGKLTPERFDRVLLDAPCSSEAQFTRLDPTSWAHWSPKKVKESARLQARLIRSAWAALKPGGRLVYSTCSLSPEENELTVQGLLAEQADAAVEAITLPTRPDTLPTLAGLSHWQGRALDPRLAQSLRILPSDRTDAFYICCLRKAA